MCYKKLNKLIKVLFKIKMLHIEKIKIKSIIVSYILWITNYERKKKMGKEKKERKRKNKERNCILYLFKTKRNKKNIFPFKLFHFMRYFILFLIKFIHIFHLTPYIPFCYSKGLLFFQIPHHLPSFFFMLT